MFGSIFAENEFFSKLSFWSKTKKYPNIRFNSDFGKKWKRRETRLILHNSHYWVKLKFSEERIDTFRIEIVLVDIWYDRSFGSIFAGNEFSSKLKFWFENKNESEYSAKLRFLVKNGNKETLIWTDTVHITE